MANGFVQVTVKGSYAGQEVLNTIWYHGDNFLADPSEGIPVLAGRLEANVWDAWCAMQLTGYLLVGFETQLYSAGWAPLLITPILSAVDRPGLKAGAPGGPGPCAIINFQPSAVGGDVAAGHGPVRRSYIAWGPLHEDAVDAAGLFSTTTYGGTAGADLLNALVVGLGDVDGMGNLTAIRVGAADGLGVRSWIVAASAAYRSRASFRRSRNN